MKKSLWLMLPLMICINSIAQNVGIGITNPSARLDITKPGGDTPTANFRGSVNISHFNFGVPEDTYIRGGKATSHVILNDLGSGKVGLGMSSPGFPLNFAPSLGDKISLWGSSGTHYGFGIQSGQLQIHTDLASSDVVFGYGSSASFNETMRIKGNGVLQFPSSLAKKIILYPGVNGDAHLGVFGNEFRISSDYYGADITFGYDDKTIGYTEKFRMKANGGFAINGSTGAANQVITSNGASVSWASPTKTLYDNTIMNIQTGPDLVLTSTTPATEIPNLSRTFTISGNTKVLVNLHIYAYAVGCSFCGVSTIYLDLQLNGVFQTRFVLDIDNGHVGHFSEDYLFDLTPGTYTLRSVAFISGPDVDLRAGTWSEKSRMLLTFISQ